MKVPIDMEIRLAIDADLEAMWGIFQAVIATGDTLPFSDDFDHETFREHWFGGQSSYVVEADTGVIGMYKFGANYPGRGSHVASATYVVGPDTQDGHLLSTV